MDLVSIAVLLSVILLMVAANALFVAAEFATVGSRKSRIQEIAATGNKSAAGLSGILRDPKQLDTYVAACQIGITISSLVAGAYGQSQLTPLLEPALGPIGGEAAAVVVVLLAVTLVQVVVGELLPKTVALRYPEQLAMATLLPMRLFLFLFRPLVTIFNGTAFAVMRLFHMNADHSHTHVHSPQELGGLYRESAAGGLIDADEREMLSGALNVSSRTVREVMTPRTRMATVSAIETVETALARVAGAPFSRFPVTGPNPEDIVGIVHVRTLFSAFERDSQTIVGTVAQAPLAVAELMTVPRLWETLRENQRRTAMVVNEYGSISGMVTLEDALEEVFGELQDEFDEEEDLVIKRGNGRSVRGDVSLATLADRYEIDLPADRADTIGGLVWHELGRLPVAGDVIQAVGTSYLLKVESMSRYAVQRVLVQIAQQEAQET